ncbi:hypothetical protein QAD02_010737 [Eretmocerus hayati]|uniref:Uncharacterized protein n=1 Tax=Eretmocerus hayati TaxID=131215 RepID=A0ACC2NWG2_9HYME|nr:hypothetical protein QAD02_010737 [Eretmocerus hayati]
MKSALAGLVTLTLLWHCIFVSTSDDPGFQKGWHFNSPNSRIRSAIFDPKLQQFLYASCNEENFPKELPCVFTMELLKSNTTISRVCHLNIKASNDKNLLLSRSPLDNPIFDPFKILDETKAILMWGEGNISADGILETSKNLTIIDFVTCEVRSHGFLLDPDRLSKNSAEDSNIVIYKGTFDLFIPDKKVCGDSGQCRLTYDYKGNKIDGPEPISTGWPSMIVEPALQNSAAKGFFVVNQFLGNNVVSHVSINGTNSPLLYPSGHKVFFKFSNTHEKFTFCWREYAKMLESDTRGTGIQCTQYDIDNLSRMINATFTYPERVDQLAVRNLLNGGFLVFTIECDAEGSAHYVANATVTKVGIDGKKQLIASQELSPGLGWATCSPNRPFDNVGIWINKGKLCYYFSNIMVNERDPMEITGPGLLMLWQECFAGQNFDEQFD